MWFGVSSIILSLKFEEGSPGFANLYDQKVPAVSVDSADVM